MPFLYLKNEITGVPWRLNPNETVAAEMPHFRRICRRDSLRLTLGAALTGRDGIARALYVTAIGQRVVVVRAFVKKSQKTPRGEIELALRRAKEIR